MLLHVGPATSSTGAAATSTGNSRPASTITGGRSTSNRGNGSRKNASGSNGSDNTRHRCRVEDPNGRYFYHLSLGVPITLICGKAFCVGCQERWSSEDRTGCGDCLLLEIDERTKQQAAMALENVRNERRQQKELRNSRLQRHLKMSAMKGESKKNSTIAMPMPSSKTSV